MSEIVFDTANVNDIDELVRLRIAYMIDDFGRIVLRTKSGELKTYHFKEIRFVL